MLGAVRSLLWGVLACLAGAVFEPAAHAAVSHATMEASSTRTPPSGERIRFDASHYPKLALPDGRQQVVRSMLNITRPMQFGNFVWDEDHIPSGAVWVRIDLARQILSIFRDGHEIGSAVILYGTDGKPTPTGSFTILEKNPDYYSRSYHAPMPYMLRLTKDGVAIHGSNVREGWATHGCIGVPLGFARLLFGVAKQGDPVVILAAQTAKRAH